MITNALCLAAGILIGRTYPRLWEHLLTAALRVRDWVKERW